MDVRPLGRRLGSAGGKLTGAGEVGHGYFGISVALSDDGDSAFIGSPKDGKGFGAAYVFTRSGETWSQRSKFSGSEEVGHANFGRRVALSSDGQTALMGGYADDENDGAAWVFVRSGENWVQQGPKLTGTAEAGAGQFGADVALSADGDTALIGGPTDGGGAGAIWFFARSGETWGLQGSKVTATGESGAAELGRSVSLAGDGTTAVAGGPGNGAGAGAAWVFTEGGEGWGQSAELAPGLIKGKGGAFGTDVSIAGDGETDSRRRAEGEDRRRRGGVGVHAAGGRMVTAGRTAHRWRGDQAPRLRPQRVAVRQRHDGLRRWPERPQGGRRLGLRGMRPVHGRDPCTPKVGGLGTPHSRRVPRRGTSLPIASVRAVKAMPGMAYRPSRGAMPAAGARAVPSPKSLVPEPPAVSSGVR